MGTNTSNTVPKTLIYALTTMLWIVVILILLPGTQATDPTDSDDQENGYQIHQFTSGHWELIHQQSFDAEYSTAILPITTEDGVVTLRIVQTGTPFGDIERITLVAEGSDIEPEYARYTDTGESVLDDILYDDNNVMVSHDRPIEISWECPSDEATLLLTANEYGHGAPLRYPLDGSFVTYHLGSNPDSIVIDGILDDTDAPLATWLWEPTSGHPAGTTYLSVCDDLEYVYFSLDVTCDNTNEFGEDWAAIVIDGREFRIDDFDDTYGRTGFGQTNKVPYKHQTVEIAVPKVELDPASLDSGAIDFKVKYYGTASVTPIVYVDDDWIGTTPGTDPDGSGPANEFGTDAFAVIQDGVDAVSSDGTVYVFAGTYTENVVISSELSLIGNGSSNTTIDGGGSGDVVQITADWVTMSGIRVTNSGSTFGDAGIEIQVDKCSIFENDCSNNNFGIFVSSSSNNTLTNNTCTSNGAYGIYLYESISNTLERNTCSQNGYGIYLFEKSDGNTLEHNTCDSNTGGIYTDFSSSRNTLTNNTCNSNTEYGISIRGSVSNIITNNTCNSNTMGIYLSESDSSSFTDNTCSGNSWCGIYLDSSDGNTFTDNTCGSNTNYGMYIWRSAGNTLTNNTCTSNDHGIYLTNSDDHTLLSNPCNSNAYYGISLFYSDSATLKGNTCNGHGDDGISINWCEDITVINNTCNSNTERGIYLGSGTGYTIERNTCNSNKYGIWIDDTSSDPIANNTCNGNSYCGIIISFAANSITLENSTCTSNQEFGIRLVSDSSTVSGSTLSGNGQSDLRVSGSSNIMTNNTFSSYPTTASFTYSGIIEVSGVDAIPSTNITMSHIGKGLNITEVTPGAWVNVSMYYQDTDIPQGYDEDALDIWKHNGSWHKTGWDNGRSLDTVNNVVSANITDFGSLFIPLITSVPSAVWVDDDWGSQSDVDLHDPTLIWQFDAFSVIQDGIDAVLTGGTVHVEDGTYRENVEVNKSLSIVGDPILDAMGGTGFWIKMNDTLIENFTVINSTTAFRVHYGSNEIHNVTLRNHTIRDCGRYGIEFDQSVNGTVEDILIEDMQNPGGDAAALYIYDSMWNEFTGITIANVTGDDNAYGLYLRDSDGNTLSDVRNLGTFLGISGTANGIYLTGSDYNIIESCTIRNVGDGTGDHGAFLQFSDFNRVANSTFTNSGEDGIYVYLCRNNTLVGNYVHNNTESGIEIGCAIISTYNVIRDNTIENNGLSGVHIHYHDTGNIIDGNTITENRYGVYLEYVQGNEITSNMFSDNSDWDLYVVGSPDNILEHNTFSSYPTTASFTYNGDFAVSGVDIIPPTPHGYLHIGKALDIINLSEDTWVNVTIFYEDSDLPAMMDESPLEIWKNNGTWHRSGWESWKGQDSTINEVSANITEFGSLFIPLASESAPPTTTKTIGDPKYDGWNWVTTSTPIRLDAIDHPHPQQSGVELTCYRIWENGVWHPTGESDGYGGNANIYSNGTTFWYISFLNGSIDFGPIFFTEEGIHHIQFYSVDLIGNTEKITNQTHYVDDSPPETTLEFEGPYYTDGSWEWITSDTLAHLNATDRPELNVGVAETSYRITRPPSTLVESVVIIVNENSPGSMEIGEYYAQQRNIPLSHICVVSSPTTEIIERDEYLDLEAQVGQFLLDKGFASTTRFLVTTKGVPLKVNGTNAIEPDFDPNGNCSSVDSELALLFSSFASGNDGQYDNPYLDANSIFDPSSYQGIYLVNRLTGRTVEDAKALVDRALLAELLGAGLSGNVYLDADPAMGGGFDFYDNSIIASYEYLRSMGFASGLENTTHNIGSADAMYSPDSSMGLPSANQTATNALLYWGWYTHPDAYHDTFEWQTGAVGQKLHSYNALTFEGNSWCAGAVADGITGTMGNVYEPFLDAAHLPDIFFDRLLAGYTFAEASYMAQPFLSWQSVVVGDPLYTPFFLGYDGPFTVPDECNNTIAYYSADNLFNTEKELERNVTVDNTPPMTSFEFGSPHVFDGIDNFITSATPLTLTAVDGPDCGCGVNTSWYRIDGGEWMAYTGAFTMPLDGRYIIEFFSTDNLGNDEETRSMEVVVDNVPPCVKKTIGDPNYGPDKLWVTSDTVFTVESSDYGTCQRYAVLIAGPKMPSAWNETNATEEYLRTIRDRNGNQMFNIIKIDPADATIENVTNALDPENFPDCCILYVYYSGHGSGYSMETGYIGGAINFTGGDMDFHKEAHFNISLPADVWNNLNNSQGRYYDTDNDGERDLWFGKDSVGNAVLYKKNETGSWIPIGRDTNNDNIINHQDGGADLNANGETSDLFSIDEGLALNDGLLNDDDLADLLSNVRCADIVVVLDACFSGGFLDDIMDAREGEQGNIEVITSTDESHCAYYLPDGYVYSRSFIENLSSGMSLQEAHEAASEAVRSAVENGTIPQQNPQHSDWTLGHYPKFLNVSGVGQENITLRINGDIVYTGPPSYDLTLDEEGEYVFEYWSVDGLGNEGDHHFQTHIVDNSPPVSAIEFGDPQGIAPGDRHWIHPDTPIFLKTTDQGPFGGVGDWTLYYRVWTGGQWYGWFESDVSTNATFTLLELELNSHCRHYIEWYAVDALGNTEPVNNYTVYLPPVPTLVSPPDGWYYRVGHTITMEHSEETGVPIIDAHYFYDLGQGAGPVEIIDSDPSEPGVQWNTYEFAECDIVEVWVELTDDRGLTCASPVNTIEFCLKDNPEPCVILIDLRQGWNLISIGVELDDLGENYTASELAYAINTQAGDKIIKYVVRYNAGTERFEEYVVDAQVGTDFPIEYGEGLYVFSVSPFEEQFAIVGDCSRNQTFDVVECWNLIGWNSPITMDVGAFADMVDEQVGGLFVQAISKYDNSMYPGDYDPWYRGDESDKFQMKPGEAYWIFVASEYQGLRYPGS